MFYVFFVWFNNVRLSVFLVVLLSATRAFLITKPFIRFKTCPIVIMVVMYVLLQFLLILVFYLAGNFTFQYYSGYAMCTLVSKAPTSAVLFILFETIMILIYIVPFSLQYSVA